MRSILDAYGFLFNFLPKKVIIKGISKLLQKIKAGMKNKAVLYRSSCVENKSSCPKKVNYHSVNFIISTELVNECLYLLSFTYKILAK